MNQPGGKPLHKIPPLFPTLLSQCTFTSTFLIYLDHLAHVYHYIPPSTPDSGWTPKAEASTQGSDWWTLDTAIGGAKNISMLMPIHCQRRLAMFWRKVGVILIPLYHLRTIEGALRAHGVPASLPPKGCVSSLSSPLFFLQIKMGRSTCIPTDSPLGCILKHQDHLDPGNLKKKHIVSYWNVAWPNTNWGVK